jgi:hypothetical protein
LLIAKGLGEALSLPAHLAMPLGDPDSPRELQALGISIEIAQTIIHKHPEHERNQQDIDAPNHPQNQRPKIVPAKERSEPLDEVKQWMLHRCQTHVPVKT